MEKSRPENERPELPKATGSLTLAIRRARIESAERSDVIADLRGAEIARLEILEDALGSLFAQVPAGIDLFDTGLVPGERPRLFLDMLAFIEMARDRRVYRFVQDTRHGRVVLAESEKVEAIVEAVTNYVARRLVEREKALAADQWLPPEPARPPAAVQPAPAAPPATAIVPARRPRTLGSTLVLLFDIIGTLLVCVLLGAAILFALKEGLGLF